MGVRAACCWWWRRLLLMLAFLLLGVGGTGQHHHPASPSRRRRPSRREQSPPMNRNTRKRTTASTHGTDSSSLWDSGDASSEDHDDVPIVWLSSDEQETANPSLNVLENPEEEQILQNLEYDQPLSSDSSRRPRRRTSRPIEKKSRRHRKRRRKTVNQKGSTMPVKVESRQPPVLLERTSRQEMYHKEVPLPEGGTKKNSILLDASLAAEMPKTSARNSQAPPTLPSTTINISIQTGAPVSKKEQPIAPRVEYKDGTGVSPWIQQFLSSRTKDALLTVPIDFFLDGFNLSRLGPVIESIGLKLMKDPEEQVAVQTLLLEKQGLAGFPKTAFPLYRQALWRVVGSEAAAQVPLPALDTIVDRAAQALYLLVHARFVCSPRGLDTVRRLLVQSGNTKSNSRDSHSGPLFGRCPHWACQGMPLLPTGPKDDWSQESSWTNRCQRYCPCCGETFCFWESTTDGCAWGTSFCHLFLLSFGDAVFSDMSDQQALRRQRLSSWHLRQLPRLYGFPIHPASTWGRLQAS